MEIGYLNNFFLTCSSFKKINGIWYSSNSSHFSYPEDGHDDCFMLEENSFWFQHRNNCIISLIKKYSPNNLFFDIGGGNGFVTKALENANISAVLVEPGKKGVQNAAKRNLENIFCGTLSDLNGLSGKVGAIGAFDVVEHIQDDNAFVENVYHMLMPNGHFFVTVPAFQFLWSDEDVDAGHYRRYNQKVIEKLLKQNGFEIEYSSYFFSFLLFPLFLIRTIPSKMGFRKKSKSQTQNEHKKNEGILGKVLNSIWKWELEKIQHQKSILFGTSCLIVAKKN